MIDTAEYDTIVVGAGISGLAAAARLQKAGKKVLVLESGSRIGGRAYTDRNSGSSHYELGCCWFHRPPPGDNALVQVAEQNNVGVADDNGNVAIVNDDGPVTNGQLLGEFSVFARTLVSDISLKSAIDQFFESKGVQPTAEDLNLLRLLQLGKGLDWSVLSVRTALGPSPGPDGEGGKPDLLVVDGYDKIVAAVGGELLTKGGNIMLNTAVTSIEETDSEVRLTTANGSSYRAKYVICSAPIGVLKANKIQFSPALDSSLASAVDSMGVGHVGKVYFEFEQAFWDETVDRFVYVGQHGPFVMPNKYKYSQDAKPTIFAIMGAGHTQQVESSPGSAFEVLKPALEAIRKDKSQPVPQPTTVTTSKWTVDPNFCGSYSTFESGSPLNREQCVEQFKRPATARVKFAGEHTTLDGATFAHGAYNSGVREADAILSVCN